MKKIFHVTRVASESGYDTLSGNVKNLSSEGVGEKHSQEIA